MLTRRLLIIVGTASILCHLCTSQQIEKDDARRETAYLFCGENPKAPVPIYAHPCEREPLKTSACGNPVTPIEQDGDWLKLMLEDQTLAFAKAASVSSVPDHFQPVHPAKQSPAYTTPECVSYLLAKQKGQPPPARVEPPHVIFSPEPEYPESVRKGGHRRDTVQLQLEVDDSGKVIDAHVISTSDKRLNQNAVDTVKRWKFKPAMKDGNPVAVSLRVVVNYQQF